MMGFKPSFLRFLATVELPLAFALALALTLAAAGCRGCCASGSEACWVPFMMGSGMCDAICKVSSRRVSVGDRQNGGHGRPCQMGEARSGERTAGGLGLAMFRLW